MSSVQPPNLPTRIGFALLGIAFGLVGLFLLFISSVVTVSGIVDRRDSKQLWWAVPVVLLSTQVVVWAGRLVLFRPRKDGGLLSPNWLLLAGLVLFAMPTVSLFTGAYKTTPLPGWFVALLAAVSPICVYGLSLKVARRKEALGRHDGSHGA